MAMYIYFIITAVVGLFGAVATIMIGNSKKNKEGNPSYDNQTGENLIRLTVFYVVSIAAGLVVFVIFIFKYMAPS